MIVLGIILLVAGYLLPLPLLVTIGWILLVIGIILFILGADDQEDPADGDQKGQRQQVAGDEEDDAEDDHDHSDQ